MLDYSKRRLSRRESEVPVKSSKSADEWRQDLASRKSGKDARWSSAKTGMLLAEASPETNLRTKLNELLAGLKEVRHHPDTAPSINHNAKLPLEGGISDPQLTA